MHKKNLLHYDIVVAGAGLAGQAMAALLGQLGLRVLVVESQPRATLTAPTHDARTTALAYGSKAILEGCGVWPRLVPHCNPIETIQVTDQQSRLKVDFTAPPSAKLPFGYIIENHHLRHALFAELASNPNLTLACPASVTAHQQVGDAVHVTLDNGQTVAAALLVAADGRDSRCRQLAGIKTHGWSYRQSALVVTIEHQYPHHHGAWEHFYPAGPFAMLPMQGNRSSIVWSDAPETLAAVTQLPQAEFVKLLQARGGAALGEIRPINPPRCYPLRFMLAEQLTAPRLALIGETAHAMHPIAGQGFNLSLRDAATLAKLIAASLQKDGDLGSPALLAQFASQRHTDHFAFMVATDLLEKLFSNHIPPLQWARRLGLGLVQQLPVAKTLFSRMAMGLLIQ